jgi:holo-[acyl-carrier protein] synthase
VIYGIGTDIVAIERIQTNLERYGERFARRILAPQELAGFEHSAKPAHYLAKRFAAKEAAVKAMGTGFRDGIGLTQIYVDHDPLGRPLLQFDGRAEERRCALGIGASYLSLSDEQHYAIAFVTLLRQS